MYSIDEQHSGSCLLRIIIYCYLLLLIAYGPMAFARTSKEDVCCFIYLHFTPWIFCQHNAVCQIWQAHFFFQFSFSSFVFLCNVCFLPNYSRKLEHGFSKWRLVDDFLHFPGWRWVRTDLHRFARDISAETVSVQFALDAKVNGILGM